MAKPASLVICSVLDTAPILVLTPLDEITVQIKLPVAEEAIPARAATSFSCLCVIEAWVLAPLPSAVATKRGFEKLPPALSKATSYKVRDPSAARAGSHSK
jgi:hypothetical protein